MSPVATLPGLTPNSPGEIGNTWRSATFPGNDPLSKVAADFESLFASQILKEMRKTLDPETMFGGDSADVFGGMFDLFLGQQMVQNGGLGLARMLREALANQRPVAP
jgi:Rod binding domain-containing protein